MKYYERLVDMGCFSRQDIEALTGGKEAANSLIFSYKKKGLIESVRRGLFVTVSLETKQPVLNRYAIAAHISDGACITHHSAFEYYGLDNQVYYEVYVSADTPFRTFEYDGVTYRHIPTALKEGVEVKKDGVRVTDIERTVIDSINAFEKIGGLEELLRCLEMVPSLDERKLLDYLSEYGKIFLYQKTGYVLEHYQKPLKLSSSFFSACQSRLPKSKRYFYRELLKEPHVWNNDWKLFVPKDLITVTKKGGAFVE